MARGQEAKNAVIQKIIAAFGEDYLGTEDNKKYYVLAPEDGQKIQVAISLTCPKTGINKVRDSLDPEDERAQINNLMERLGL